MAPSVSGKERKALWRRRQAREATGLECVLSIGSWQGNTAKVQGVRDHQVTRCGLVGVGGLGVQTGAEDKWREELTEGVKHLVATPRIKSRFSRCGEGEVGMQKAGDKEELKRWGL